MFVARAAIALAATFAAFTCLRASAEVAVVLNSRDDDMSLIDTASYREIARVPIGKEPHHLIATPDERELVVGNTKSNDLVFLDPASGEIKRRLPRIADPYHLGFSPNGQWFVVNGNRLDRVDIYRHEGGRLALARQLHLPSTPSHMAFTPDSRRVYVTLQESDRVAAIELGTQQVLWQAPVGRQPAGIWYVPATRQLLVAITGEDYVQVLTDDSGAPVARLRTGRGAHNFLPKGDGRHLFVSNRVDNTVCLLDMLALRVLECFPVPGGPDDMELRRDGSELWVTSRWINRISVIDMKTRQLKHSIRVGRSPHGLYFRDHAPRQ